MLKNIVQLVFLTLLILLSSSFTSRLLSQSRNTLYDNGHWVVAKVRLKMGVMGAYGFLACRNTLAGERLDLSKWYGFQEVIYKDPLDIKEISFDFLLGQDSWFAFIFNKGIDKFSGIRVSTNSFFKDLYFVSKASGEFLGKQELKIPDLRPNSWQHFKMIFGRNNFTLYVNEASVGTFNITLLQNQLFGFRGGKNKVLIDNVVIRLNHSQQIIRETFGKRDKNVLLLFIIIAAFNIITGLLCRVIFKDTIAHGIVRLIYLNLLATGVLFLLLKLDYFYISRQYPNWIMFHNTLPQDLKTAEDNYWNNAGESFILSSIKNKYPAKSGQDSYRILFLGTSQVWGAGASEKSKTFVHRIETRLNASNNSRTRYECINAGISGIDLYQAVDIYMKALPDLNPKIVVFILPPNPFSNVVISYLNKLIQFNNSRMIKTIILAGPMSIENYSGPSPLSHSATAFFEKNNMRIMGLRDYFIKNYDRGFLFWDNAHLTDYGQELAAAYIYKIIHQQIVPTPRGPSFLR